MRIRRRHHRLHGALPVALGLCVPFAVTAVGTPAPAHAASSGAIIAIVDGDVVSVNPNVAPTGDATVGHVVADQDAYPGHFVTASMDDDGTIYAVNADTVYQLTQAGTEIGAWDPPHPGKGQLFGGISDSEVRRDGGRIITQSIWSNCNGGGINEICNVRSITAPGSNTTQGSLINEATASWLGTSNTVIVNGAIEYYRLGDAEPSDWFEDPDLLAQFDAEATTTGDGSVLAIEASYQFDFDNDGWLDFKPALSFYRVDAAPPAVPDLRCRLLAEDLVPGFDNNADSINDISFSPDGTALAFTAGRYDDSALYVLRNLDVDACTHGAVQRYLDTGVSHVFWGRAGYTTTDGGGPGGGGAGGYQALPAPVRLLDSRAGGATQDGAFAGIGRRPAGSILELPIAGRGGIPATAASVVLNVTAVDPAGDGYLTVFPCGEAQPNTSNVNYATGQVIPNAVIAKVGAGGKVCIYTYADTEILVDAAASFASTQALAPLPAPVRLLDTRAGGATQDGAFAGAGRRPAGSILELPIAGRGGIPANAVSVVLNVTAASPAGDGYLTVFPCGEAQPNTSNLNYTAGQVIPNAVIAKVGAGGKVCIYTYADTEILVDAAASFGSAEALAPLAAPVRLLDSRAGGATHDGAFAGTGRLPAGTVLELPVAGRGGVPANAASVVLNVTAVNPAGDGYLTVFPCGEAQPNTSNVNYRAGQVIPNAVIAKAGAGGKVCIYTYADTDVLVDVAASFKA